MVHALVARTAMIIMLHLKARLFPFSQKHYKAPGLLR